MTLQVHLFLTGCKGTIKFFDDSHEYSITVSSEKLIRSRARKRRIRKWDPEFKTYSTFKYAKVEGDCVWEIRSKPPSRGGESITFKRAGTYESTFNIQSVTLTFLQNIDQSDLTEIERSGLIEIDTRNLILDIDNQQIKNTNNLSVINNNETNLKNIKPKKLTEASIGHSNVDQKIMIEFDASNLIFDRNNEQAENANTLSTVDNDQINLKEKEPKEQMETYKEPSNVDRRIMVEINTSNLSFATFTQEANKANMFSKGKSNNPILEDIEPEKQVDTSECHCDLESIQFQYMSIFIICVHLCIL